MINGTPVAETKYPWMVSLRHKYSGHFCGGVLLNSTTVLTAAHCAEAMTSRLSWYGAWAAVTDFSNSENALKFKILKKTLHPQYTQTDTSISNDVAIIKVKLQSGDPSLIIPMQVSLDNGNYSMADTRLNIAGWGLTKEGDPLSGSNQLLEGAVSIVSRVDCAKKYNTTLSPSNICAAGEGQDTCQGD